MKDEMKDKRAVLDMLWYLLTAAVSPLIARTLGTAAALIYWAMVTLLFFASWRTRQD